MDWLSVGLIPVVHELTASQIIAVAGAVHQHVQSCFDREEELLPLIEVAESPEELDAITW